MSKPDDVPQQVWDDVLDINLILPINHVQAEIARLIMAAKAKEREAIIEVCKEPYSGWFDYSRETSNMQGAADEARRIISAIRSRA